MEGQHTLADCQQATARFLKATFGALRQRNIFLPGVILKTNMVLPGLEGPGAGEADCVEKTISTLETMVPSTTGAVVFLSGGQETTDAMRRLEEMRIAATRKRLPFTVSSSFSRALQGPALEKFGAAIRERATAADVKKRTQAKFAETLKLNGLALKRSAAH